MTMFEECSTISRAMCHYRDPDRPEWTFCGSSARRLTEEDADLPVCSNCAKSGRAYQRRKAQQ